MDIALVGRRLQGVDLVPVPCDPIADQPLDRESPLRGRQVRRRFRAENRPVRTDVVLARRQPRIAYLTAASFEVACELHHSLP